LSSTISSDSVENCLRKILLTEGYSLSRKRQYGETGVDILAKKDKEIFHIEVIGYKSSPPRRSMEFYQVFFRAISRLEDQSSHCVLALPVQFRVGLPQRVNQYRTAWNRIAKAFPELEIWLINVEVSTYQRTKWSDWQLI